VAAINGRRWQIEKALWEAPMSIAMIIRHAAAPIRIVGKPYLVDFIARGRREFHPG